MRTYPGLHRHLLSVTRYGGTDAQGNPGASVLTSFSMRGTVGTPSEVDQAIAGRQGEVVEQTVSYRPHNGNDLQIDDVVGAIGQSFRVIRISDSTWGIKRAALRRVQ